MKLAAGVVVAERFRLIRQLGQGGMGAVWLAQDTTLDTPCAIKFILADAADFEQLRVRFEREAKSAAQLRSPHVVHILDHGISDGTPFIAMEYLEGEDLGERLKRVGRLAPQETVAILSQVAKALVKAQAAGLVHRDLKPANIFLSRDEDHDFVRVLDFGVAKSTTLGTGEGSTKTGAMLGTPYYMSPEQARGNKAIDHRSDLWAIGVIAFQCVAGRLPFLSDSLGDLLMQIITEPLPVPSVVAPGLPPAFDAWWARAMMRDPARRFQTARELVDGLALALEVAQSAMTAGVASFAAPGAAFHESNAQRPPSGALNTPASGQFTAKMPSWPSSPDAGQAGLSSPGFVPSSATVALSSSSSPSHGGVATSSVAERPPAPRRRTGLLLALGGGAMLLCGALAAAYVAGAPSPAASSGATASALAPPAAPAPPPAPTASATAALVATATATATAEVPAQPAAPATAAAATAATSSASTAPSAAPVGRSAKPPPVVAPTARSPAPPAAPASPPKPAKPVDQVGF